MTAGLTRFARELRRRGLAVSTAEWIDALRAVEGVGIENRSRFRLALRATLVKRRADGELFERAFDAAFAKPAWGAARAERGTGAGRGARGRSGEREQPGDPSRRPTPARPEAAQAQPGPGAVPRERRGEPRLRAFDPRTPRGAGDASPTRRTGRLRRVLVEPQAVRAAMRRLAGPTNDPLRRDLRRAMSREEERELARELPKLLRRIRLRSGRRLRRRRSGRIRLRGVFRANASHDGVPFVLPRVKPKLRHPKVVLLVDVSWSVARAAGLFLWMACELLRWGRTTRVLLFVDRPVEAGDALARWSRGGAEHPPRQGSVGARAETAARAQPGSEIAPAGVGFASWLDSIPDLDRQAPSDYGRVFHRLLVSARRPQGRDTLLVILGDGRTNRLDPQDWALEEIASRCGVVIWLVPEPRARWGTGDSELPAYSRHVDEIVETRDLQGLARGVSELLRRL